MTEDDERMRIRVLRVYHGGRDFQHRGRERALEAAGVDVTLVVPTEWPETSGERNLSPETFGIVELPVRRAGDVNRHAHVEDGALRRLIAEIRPDVLDVHEEPFSVVARQWLRAAPDQPVLMYTGQNVDKRFPPPFSRFETAAYRRVGAFYACSRQAASVLRGKGFTGTIEVLPLGYDDTMFRPGSQSLDSDEIVLMLAGRLVPEKGVDDAVRTLARVHAIRPARLVVCGSGPEAARARALASSLGVGGRLQLAAWQSGEELASNYRAAHVVLVPSRPTETWVEQFGRVIVEAQASGAVVAGYASGAIPEVAGEAGMVVPTGDVERLAEVVARVVADPDEFAWRRAAGHLQAATRTWSAVAARQAALYRIVQAGQNTRLKLPSSPRRRRAEARAEFGTTAWTMAGERPFAVPILRRGGAAARGLAATIDVTGEIASHISR
jgi:glycosyltransferase involved in cell wall biosynthesis